MESMYVNPQSSTGFLFHSTIWTSVDESFKMNFCMSPDLILVRIASPAHRTLPHFRVRVIVQHFTNCGGEI